MPGPGRSFLTLLLAGLVVLGPACSRPLPRTVASPKPPPVSIPAPPTPTPTPAEYYQHVVVLVLENRAYEQVIGSAQAPYLNSLAQRWSLATGYSGVSHPSLPNYLAMIGGSTYGISSDCTACFVSAPSLPDRLDAAGKTWKGYMEGLPSPCFVGSAGEYAQKHDPFVYFDAIRQDPERCSRIVPYSQLAGDFSSASTTPDFAFVAPNLCHDGHDCPNAAMDAWLAREVPALIASPGFDNGYRSLLVITFDEGEGGSNRVATILVGGGVKQGYQSAAAYDHYSLLRTIEGFWQLPPLAAGDSAAIPMTEFLTLNEKP